MMFKAFFKPVALAALLALSATPAAAGDLEISGAWLRAVPPVSPTMAGYFELRNRGDRVVEALFTAFFEQGRNIGDAAVLTGIGLAVDPEDTDLGAWLASDDDRDMMAEADAQARRIGVDGVPCFIIDGRWAVMGAQAPEQMMMALVRAATNPAGGGVADDGEGGMSDDDADGDGCSPDDGCAVPPR